MSLETVEVPEEAKGKRLDSFLSGCFSDQYSRTRVKELILAGEVLVDGRPEKPHFLLFPGQRITANLSLRPDQAIRAENIPLDILFEDDDLVLVNKPAGMVVHPACGHTSGTLVNALLHHAKKLSKVGGDIRAGIVHRLDKNTSGLLIVAKTDEAHQRIARQFKRRQIKKIYWAVVKGVVEHNEMKADIPLGRSRANRKLVVACEEEGKPAQSFFKVLERFRSATLLEVRPTTGRMHQIRVHLRHLGYPVLGDKEYGSPTPLINRQALHAKSISFRHPETGKTIIIDSDLPSDMAKLLKTLRSEKKR